MYWQLNIPISFNLVMALQGGIILQKGKVRHRSLNDLPKVIELVRAGEK